MDSVLERMKNHEARMIYHGVEDLEKFLRETPAARRTGFTLVAELPAVAQAPQQRWRRWGGNGGGGGRWAEHGAHGAAGVAAGAGGARGERAGRAHGVAQQP